MLTGNIFPTDAITNINANDNIPPTPDIILERYPNFTSDRPGLNGFT